MKPRQCVFRLTLTNKPRHVTVFLPQHLKSHFHEINQIIYLQAIFSIIKAVKSF